MLKQMPNWWRLVCLAHLIIAWLFGFLFLLAPDAAMVMVGWPIVDPYIDRILGGALIAMGWAHFLSSKEKTAEKLVIAVQLYWIFDVLGTILSAWALAAYASWSAGMLMVIYGFFCVAYSIVLFKK